jgi:probable rRNA maturation factor
MILNRQRGIRVPMRKLEDFAREARRALRLPEDSFAVCLVSDAEIARWNKAYRGKNKATDVLSFPANEEASRNGMWRKTEQRTRGERRAVSRSETQEKYLGDIAIAPAVARRNALRFGRTFEQEMRILIVHGMLHLMGYDHETDDGEMDRKERRLRRALKLE